jgi:hypothetical protein
MLTRCNVVRFADRIARPQRRGYAAKHHPEHQRLDQRHAAHGSEHANADGQDPEEADQHLAEGATQLKQSGAHVGAL